MRSRDERPSSSGLAERESVARDRAPIDLYPRVGDDRWSDHSLARVTWGFVALGVAIRLVRWMLNHPLWGDECFVAANLIDRGYLALLRPLDYQQVVPVLFLWGERAVVDLFGFSERSLRALPTAFAVASLFAFRHLAARLMKGMPLLLAVAIVAVSLNPIRHGGEAKPYSADFLASTVVLALVVEWWRRPERSTGLWALAATTPLAMGLSLPSAFVLAGVSLAVSGRVWKVRDRRVLASFVAFNGAIAAGVAANLLLYGGRGSAATKAYMDHYWSAQFPPLHDPPRLIAWLVKAHTGHLFAYPVGASNGASLLTVVASVAGFVGLWRRGRGTIALACLAPLGLALAASAIRAYPYGESERLMQFEGPMICLLAGFGLALALGRLRQAGAYRRAAIGVLVGFGAIGLGVIAADLLQPGRSPQDLRAREFARWFWQEAGRDSELACSLTDLGLDFEGGEPHDGRSADYRTYQAIYSPRHRLRTPLDWPSLSPGHPLRCVVYDGVPVDSTLFEGWMARMARHYRATRVDTYRVNSGYAPRGVSSEDHYAVLEFVPIGPPVDPKRLASEAAEAESRARRGSLSLSPPRSR